ncbi:hypothetical protein GAO09_15630 [Rhizobiales bacterium RZME27]|uniref:Uncharacterized protein n=1 Tax=Endobacterium cereale TaxID=2663029 RepID=A0A6A8A9U6_9HYPH|nr:hypothetical protein [Endobacterium cereale]MEB2847119.1 hypothetical protein [Endobacterium cereale]MQY47464.1 hypothetical protein [Endobacterium cereale]
MEKARTILATILSTLGLAGGLFLGFALAGPLGALTFAPVGALLGLFVGSCPLTCLSLLD